MAIGAGNRMRTYLHYVKEHPDQVQLVAVVEPDTLRRQRTAQQFQLPATACFSDCDTFFAADIAAEAVIICTPEQVHYHPCMQAICHGYNVLLEKPIAQTLQQCHDISAAAQRHGAVVGICHVLRYFPAYLKLRDLIHAGTLGQLIAIHHREGVGIDRATHSYVRGTMNREHESNPMLLAKCCHDIDLCYWLAGVRCRRVASYGARSWFRSEHAPSGAAERCIHCSVEPTCPFSAVDLYQRRKQWISNFDIPDGQTIDDVVEQELHHGRYGRCVYRCDNDVVDHQDLIMEMENEVTVSLAMDIFTADDTRTTHVLLSHGEIHCNEQQVEVIPFGRQPREVFDYSDIMRQPFHGNADLRLFGDFIATLRGDSATALPLIADGIESHRICFEAERCRQRKG